MANWDIEQRLKRAIDRTTPDLLDSVLLKCENREGLVDDMTDNTRSAKAVQNDGAGENAAPKKKKTWKVFSGIAAACLLLVIGVFGYDQIYSVDSVIELDVNPSIELNISKSEKVRSAEALNKDAAAILDDMDLKGVDLDVAVNAILGSMVKNGYIDEMKNSILISVENQDADKGAALQERLSDEINRMLKAYSLEGAVVSQTITSDKELAALAEQCGISIGKAAMIQKIVQEDPTKTFDGLAGASINELNLLAAEKGTSGVKTVGSASTGAYIGEGRAKAAALSHAGFSESEVTFTEVKLDYDDGRVVYEVEFYMGNTEYDYEIDALDGTVVEYDADREERALLKQPANTPASGGYIGEAKAKSIAISHAGLSESAVTFTKTELDDDDGRAEYEVDFRSGNVEYDYEIDAVSGTILDYDKDTDDDWHDDDRNKAASSEPNTGSVTAGAQISADQALSAALSHAGVAKADASRIETELDYDDGRSEYEVKFYSNGMEYEYKIDAASGEILQFESEYDD